MPTKRFDSVWGTPADPSALAGVARPRTGHEGGGGGGGGSCCALSSTPCGGTSNTTPSVTISYTLADTTAPTISIASPAANAVYPLGASVAAFYSCADEAGGSGLDGCQGPVLSGAAIDTSTPAAHGFTVSAADSAGNTASRTVDDLVAAAPSASVTVPAASGIYALGQSVRTSFACASPQRVTLRIPGGHTSAST